jgi:hypothetical protein
MTGWGSTASKPGMFSFGPKAEEPPAAVVQLAEQMLITEIPNSAQRDFKAAFESIQNMANDLAKAKIAVDDPTTTESIIQTAKYELLAALPAFAHRIDAGKHTVANLRTALDKCRAEGGAGTAPAAAGRQFLGRYVTRLEKASADMDFSLRAYGEHLQARHGTRRSDCIREMLEQQYEAILRCSKRMADLEGRLRKQQIRVEEQLRVDFGHPEETTSESGKTVAEVLQRYRRFEQEQRRAEDDRIARSDLFGRLPPPPAKPAAQTTGWGTTAFKPAGTGAATTGSPLARTQTGAQTGGSLWPRK